MTIIQDILFRLKTRNDRGEGLILGAAETRVLVGYLAELSAKVDLETRSRIQDTITEREALRRRLEAE